MSEITQALLAGGAVALAFGVWAMVKLLENTRKDIAKSVLHLEQIQNELSLLRQESRLK